MSSFGPIRRHEDALFTRQLRYQLTALCSRPYQVSNGNRCCFSCSMSWTRDWYMRCWTRQYISKENKCTTSCHFLTTLLHYRVKHKSLKCCNCSTSPCWQSCQLHELKKIFQHLQKIHFPSSACTNHEFMTLRNWSSICWTFGTVLNRVQLIAQCRGKSASSRLRTGQRRTFWSIIVTVCNWMSGYWSS